ncbi:MAG: peptidoglycan-binding protein, partial [Candidatus Pacebacteria bacterium]|nr:peptidoglycan-binding protein [Candidatus Paceibacterota bacterium]
MKNYFKGFLLIGFLFSFLLSPNLIHAQVDPNATTSGTCTDLQNNLKFGDKDINKNGEVTLLQKYLRANGYLTISPSGYFGSSTFKAVIEFQKANSLKPAFGYVGSLTREKIKVLSCVGEASVEFTANPTEVASGGSTTLNWSAQGVSSCVASGDWTGTKSAYGLQTMNNLTSNKTYVLTCTNASGVSTKKEVTVSVNAPIVEFTANPTEVASGGFTTLNWSAQGVSSCVASGDWTGTKSAYGLQTMNNLTSNKTYVL